MTHKKRTKKSEKVNLRTWPLLNSGDLKGTKAGNELNKPKAKERGRAAKDNGVKPRGPSV